MSVQKFPLTHISSKLEMQMLSQVIIWDGDTFFLWLTPKKWSAISSPLNLLWKLYNEAGKKISLYLFF